MTKKLSECPYCKRPADEIGGINHVGGCTGLQEVPMNRLQYDILRGNLSLAEEGLASATQEIAQVKACWAEALANVTARNQEIERLREVIDNRDKALGFVEVPSHEPGEQLVTTDYGPALLAICKWSGCTSTMAEGDPYFCPTHRELARRNAEKSGASHGE